MRIVNLETHLVRLPYSSGGRRSEGDPTNWATLDSVLVRIDTEDGVTGWGDAFAYGVPEATRAVLEHRIKPLVLGRDAGDIEGMSRFLQQANHLWGRYGITLFAISGVDIALWDIAGKVAGLPLHRLLGGARRLRLPAYASLFRYGDPEVVARFTRKALDEGFGYIKLHETGEAQVAAARAEAGERVPLMVDTNCPWTPLQAAAMAERLAPYDLHWLEEPIFPPEDFASLARLQAESGIPLAAGENACTVYQFQQMLDVGAVTYAQPSVTKVGGVTEMRKVIALAEARGIQAVPHSPYFGPGLLASLHLTAMLPDEAVAEFLYYDTLGASLYGEAVRPVDGSFTVPDGPGLGLDPDPDVLREYGS